MKRKILLAEIPRELKELKAISKPVAKVTKETKQLVTDMFSEMHAGNGIGLSAPQLGVLQRIIIAEYKEGKSPVPKTAIINPEITWVSKKQVLDEEGCLSFPNLYGMVKRPEKIKYRGLDENGKQVEGKATGLLARIIQHEYDHLDGILFIEKVEGDLYTYEKEDGATL
ncbi:MAG: peptide deformylase [Patescibacteria group bacterium]|jgi:peptide deformylase